VQAVPTYPGGDVVVKQGQTWSEVLTYRDQTGALIDFTGYSAKMDIRTPSGTLAIHLDNVNGGIVLGGAAGTVTRTLTAAQTQSLTPGVQYDWDLYVTSAGGAVLPPLEGTFTTRPRITQ
jgi:hypothetical protein